MFVKITNFAHGTTTDNEAHISSGWSDPELSLLGIEQSEKLKNLIKDKNFDAVFSSDLKRALDTAKLAFEGRNVTVTTDSRLRECNYGKLNGSPESVVEPMCESECIYNPFPEGESYEDVKARIVEFLDFLGKNYNGKSVAIVSHKAPQLAFEVLLNNKTWEQALVEDWRNTKSWVPGWEYNLE
ncbi:histidine phosphatase family protein [Candidatus Nomurabacteria bacterium]|nr:histidine phosphatase family protein [Candidatus Nomurabacteria bacterium]